MTSSEISYHYITLSSSTHAMNLGPKRLSSGITRCRGVSSVAQATYHEKVRGGYSPSLNSTSRRSAHYDESNCSDTFRVFERRSHTEISLIRTSGCLRCIWYLSCSYRKMAALVGWGAPTTRTDSSRVSPCMGCRCPDHRENLDQRSRC